MVRRAVKTFSVTGSCLSYCYQEEAALPAEWQGIRYGVTTKMAFHFTAQVDHAPELSMLFFRKRLLMSQTAVFHDMKIAPLEGTAVEVRHGADQMIVVARWAGQNQAWVRDDDTDRRSLHLVIGWRPVAAGRSSHP